MLSPQRNANAVRQSMCTRLLKDWSPCDVQSQWACLIQNTQGVILLRPQRQGEEEGERREGGWREVHVFWFAAWADRQGLWYQGENDSNPEQTPNQGNLWTVFTHENYCQIRCTDRRSYQNLQSFAWPLGTAKVQIDVAACQCWNIH